MKKNGFTLIEAVLALVLLAGGLLGIMTLFQRNVSNANVMEQTLKATFLAQERMEQIILDKKYKLYPFIVSANYPTSENLTAQGFPGYTRTIQILEVDSNNLSSASNGSGYKRITVAVSVSGGDTVTLTTLLTKWGEP